MDMNIYGPMLNSGAIYCTGRTKDGFQPVIIFNLKKLHSISPQLEERAKCAWLFFEWVLNNMMVPGHIESWFIIMDFDGIGLTQLPVGELKGMVGSL